MGPMTLSQFGKGLIRLSIIYDAVASQDDDGANDQGPGDALEGELVSQSESGFDIRIPGVDPDLDGLEPTQRERFEEGLQDTLDLRDWRMPELRDYFWYLVVYTTLIALAVLIIWRYRMLWAYVLWGGYLVTLVVLASLIVRSLKYRRGTYSKSYVLSTLDIQQAVEDAVEDVGLDIARVEQPDGMFLRPMIAVYVLEGRGFTVNVEGRPHLRRKVVRVGRFHGLEDLDEGRRLCNALDERVEVICEGKRRRALFREETC